MQEKLNAVIEERREDAERKAAERKELETHQETQSPDSVLPHENLVNCYRILDVN